MSDPRVAIRRKSDGLYLARGAGHLKHFSTVPSLLKSEAKAIVKIRVDLGDDLADYDIVPAADIPPEVLL